MARALSIVRHQVTEYDKWHAVYDEVQPLRDKHGVNGANVMQNPDDPNDVTVLHWYPSLENAQAFVSDPGLRDAMERAGVSGPPRIEIVVED